MTGGVIMVKNRVPTEHAYRYNALVGTVFTIVTDMSERKVVGKVGPMPGR